MELQSINLHERDVLVLLVIRLLVGFFTWFHARTSYVYTISIEIHRNSLGSTSLAVAVVLMVLKLLAAYLLDSIVTITSEEESVMISQASLRRIFVGNLFLLGAEVMMAIILVLELDQPTSLNFIRAIITTASLFALLSNRSDFLIFWIMVVLYLIGMIIIIYPRSADSSQRKPETTSLLLFFRSLLLPI